MFDIGWTELVIIGVVALIVIGPKDLPEMFRTLGRFTAKLRSMAREFQRAMESAADEAGVKDVAKDLKGMTSAKSMGLDRVKDSVAKFEKWDPLKPAAKPAPKPNVALGPNTQALADKVAERKAVAVEAAEKLRATSAPLAAGATPAEVGPAEATKDSA